MLHPVDVDGQFENQEQSVRAQCATVLPTPCITPALAQTSPPFMSLVEQGKSVSVSFCGVTFQVATALEILGAKIHGRKLDLKGIEAYVYNDKVYLV